MRIYDNDFGNIEVRTLLLPEYVKEPTGTYTPSGKVLISYVKDSLTQNDCSDSTSYIAIVNDDGSEFKDIYEGIIKPHPTANRIRYMVYTDNKRILLGDYVLECAPDIDSCKKAELIPVKYPFGIDKDDRVFCHWSEIIISPDNQCICWTMLTKGFGAVNMIGRLVREEDCYNIKDTQIISSINMFLETDKKDGCLELLPHRGGEVKQFIRGGTAISLVGAGKTSVLADTVVQDLLSEEIIQITHSPGYDETTIFSPDEKVGIVMSSRVSMKTNCAIMGLLPRPYGMLVNSSLIQTAYEYSVAGVRRFRKGNIGPVLINIEKSINDVGYIGVPLNDPEERWVYLSPMSWHPNNKRAMWPEMLRGEEGQKRIQIVELHDYQPSKSIESKETPLNIPYGIRDEQKLFMNDSDTITGKILGKHCGHIEYQRFNVLNQNNCLINQDIRKNTMRYSEARYINYSDDGRVFYNGFEKNSMTLKHENIYEADVKMTGEEQGEMKLRLYFEKDEMMHTELSFRESDDGMPKSYGYAEYNGTRLTVEDMKD